jgi:Fe-S cluster assembly iron-binding protein IscA
MLTLTETATTAVKAIISGNPEIAGGGLRIGEGLPEDSPGFAVSVVANPEPGDSTVERDGARVFLEPAASLMLDDKTLDAQVENGSVTFALVPQV